MSFHSIARAGLLSRRGAVLLAALLLLVAVTGPLVAPEAGAAPALEEAVGGSLSPCVVGVLALIAGLASGDGVLISVGGALIHAAC